MADKNTVDNEVDEAVIVTNVSKEFKIPHERKTTLFESISGAFRPNTYEKFVALDKVSFTVRRGESIGIIGDNGSGKSTILKIIAGILRPSDGKVKVNGRITPFLELGVGFQPDLTARENIEVYSTIMGMSEKEIQRNIDTVLEFAGLKKFRDAKLKNFSSGMQVRLAFATAIQIKPEILLVDEVLAVGDIEFQQKCLDIFTEYKKSGVTILFVSHDLSAVRRFCDKTILMKHGELVVYGKTSEVIDKYVYGADSHDENNAAVDNPPKARNDRIGNQKITISKVILYDKYGRENDRFNTGDMVTINIVYCVNEPLDDLVFGIAIYSDMDVLCYGNNTEVYGMSLGHVSRNGKIVVRIPSIGLLSGKFYLTVAAHSKNNVIYDWLDKNYSFNVINTGRVAGIYDLKTEWSKLS